MVLRTAISLEIALLTKRKVLLLSLAVLALPQARFRAERSCLSRKSPTLLFRIRRTTTATYRPDDPHRVQDLSKPNPTQPAAADAFPRDPFFQLITHTPHPPTSRKCPTPRIINLLIPLLLRHPPIRVPHRIPDKLLDTKNLRTPIPLKLPQRHPHPLHLTL